MKKGLKYTLLAICGILAVGLSVGFHILGSQGRKALICKGVNVTITDSTVNSFISAADARHYLDSEYGDCIGHRLDSLELDKIEKMLEGKTAVLNSEVYVTRDGMLNVLISQRKPAVRFLGRNTGYYADEKGETFPLQKTYASYVPVIDGDIPDMTDTLRIRRIVDMVNHIEKSRKWKDKFVQMTVDSTGNMTLIPREGRERFLIGQPTDIDAKLERLEMYYSHIIPEKGSDRYKSVDLRYTGQIICR